MEGVVSNYVWLDVFDFLPPARLGLELAFLSNAFDALAEKGFKARRWAFGCITICRSPDGIGAVIIKQNTVGQEEVVPMPEETPPFPLEPPPRGVIGFGRITVRNSNQRVIGFLSRIRRLFEFNLSLVLAENFNNDVFVNHIWPILHPLGIVRITCFCTRDLEQLRNISPTVLCDCTNLRTIRLSSNEFLTFPPDDHQNVSVRRAVCKWLHLKRSDSRPKVLINNALLTKNVWFDQLKETFLNASKPACFIICVITESIVPERLENTINERLEVRATNDIDRWLIERGPRSWDAQQWAEYEPEALGEIKIDNNVFEMK